MAHLKTDYNQLERLSLFITGLRSDADFNAVRFVKYLEAKAPHLECCSKTIKRDIKYLKESLTCPIYYNKNLHRYILTEKDWQMPDFGHEKINDFTIPSKKVKPDLSNYSKVIIKVSPRLRFDVENAPWCRSKKLLETRGYSLIYEAATDDFNCVRDWTLAQAGKVEIIGPDNLRREILHTAKMLYDAHKIQKQNSDIEYLPFEEARTFIHSLNLRSSYQWGKYCESGEKPENIPVKPQKVYKNEGWVNMNDWLGYSAQISKKMETLAFEEARKYIQTLKIKSAFEFHELCRQGRIPKNISYAPSKFYKEWKGYNDWLGI